MCQAEVAPTTVSISDKVSGWQSAWLFLTRCGELAVSSLAAHTHNTQARTGTANPNALTHGHATDAALTSTVSVRATSD